MRGLILSVGTGLALLATVGAASASDDCASGGFYAVCLFHDHYAVVGEPGICGYESRTSNEPAAMTLVFPEGTLDLSVRQATDDRYTCAFLWHSRVRNESSSTLATATYQTTAGSGSMVAGQSESRYESYTYSSLRESTSADVRQSVASREVSAGAGQQAGRYSCGLYAHAMGTYLPVAPCYVAGVNAALPQLTRECLWSDWLVCGTFPDWPDGTGLPFL